MTEEISIRKAGKTFAGVMGGSVQFFDPGSGGHE